MRLWVGSGGKKGKWRGRRRAKKERKVEREWRMKGEGREE